MQNATASGEHTRDRQFYEACSIGDLDSVKASIYPGLDINRQHECTSSDIETSLHVSVIKGHLHVVGFLLALGADLEKMSAPYDGYTALHWATSTANPKAMRLLIDSGADLGATYYAADYDRGSVLFLPLDRPHRNSRLYLVEDRHYEAIQLLLDEGLHINTPGEEFAQGNLMDRAILCDDDKLVQWLSDRGAKPSNPDEKLDVYT